MNSSGPKIECLVGRHWTSGFSLFGGRFGAWLWCHLQFPFLVSVSSCRQRRCAFVLKEFDRFPGISSQNRNVLQVLSQHKVAEKIAMYPCMILGTPPRKMDGLEKLTVSFPSWEQWWKPWLLGGGFNVLVFLLIFINYSVPFGERMSNFQELYHVSFREGSHWCCLMIPSPQLSNNHNPQSWDGSHEILVDY